MKRTQCDNESYLPASKKSTGTKLSISYKDAASLSFAFQHVPESTPKRWDIISTLVKDFKSQSSENICSPSIIIKDCSIKTVTDKNNTLKLFEGSPSECKHLVNSLSKEYDGFFQYSENLVQDLTCTYSDKTGLKRFILLPPVKQCCGEDLFIRNRPSFPIVYTMSGTYIGALFTGECRKGCHMKYSHSYYHCDGRMHFYDSKCSSVFFHITTQTVFSKKLLDDFTNNISVSAASFQSRAEVYNENFRECDSKRLKGCSVFGRSTSDTEHPWKLTEKRVEDAWFTYALVDYYNEFNLLNETNFHTLIQGNWQGHSMVLIGS